MAALRALLDAASAASRLLIQDALGLMLRPDSMVLGTRGERCKWRRWLAHHSMLAAAAAWTAYWIFSRRLERDAMILLTSLYMHVSAASAPVGYILG